MLTVMVGLRRAREAVESASDRIASSTLAAIGIAVVALVVALVAVVVSVKWRPAHA